MSERPQIPANYIAPGLDLDDLNEQPADDAYPRLSSAQIETLAAFGERRPFTSGEPLFEAGAEAADFVVVVSGAVALLVDGPHRPRPRPGQLHRRVGAATRRDAAHDPGRGP